MQFKNKLGLFKRQLVSLLTQQFSQITYSPQRILVFSTLLLMSVVVLSLSLPRPSSGTFSVSTQPSPQQNELELQQLRDENLANHVDQSAQQATLSQSFIEEYDRLSTTSMSPTLDPQVDSQTEPVSLMGLLSLGLLIVVVVVYVIRWIGSNPSNNYRQNGSSYLSDSIVVRLSKELEPGQKLQLIQFGNEFLLLGVTSQTISLLTKYLHDDLPVDLSARLQPKDKVSDRSFTRANTAFAEAEQSSLSSLVQSLEQLRQLQHEDTSQT